MLELQDLALIVLSPAIAEAVLKPLYEPVAEFFATNVSSSVLSRWKLSRDTVKLAAPEDLPGMIAQGQVKPGQMIQGTGYFSLLRPTHLRQETQLHNMTSMMSALFSGGPEAVANAVMHVTAATKLPVLNGTRVAFIYPHHMWGFGVQYGGDGTPRTTPFLSRTILLVKEGTWLGLPDRIVEFRARLMLIDAADLKAVMPEYTDDVYDSLLGAGQLCFLDAREDDCFVRDYDKPPNSTMLGAHVLSAHWELGANQDGQRNRFLSAIDAGLAQACASLQCPVPGRTVDRAERDAGSVTWALSGFQVYQPATGPTIHVQVNTDFRNSAIKAEVEANFGTLTSNITAAIDNEFSIKRDAVDADFTDIRDTPKMTILQSSAARHVDAEPVLGALRHWLEKQ